MNAAEIVVGKMQSDRSFQMRQFLAERICQARVFKTAPTLYTNPSCGEIVTVGVGTVALFDSFDSVDGNPPDPGPGKTGRPAVWTVFALRNRPSGSQVVTLSGQ